MEDDEFGVASVFTEFGTHLGQESVMKDDLRLVIRELEQVARDIHSVTQRVHRPGGVTDTTGVTVKVRQKFDRVKELFGQLDTKLPENSYWKYCQLWSNTASWISFLASLTIYLESETLATKEQVSEMMGLANTTTAKLDIEEYLVGLCQVSNELSRLCVNCVTSEDYSRPVRIAEFITSLNTGFRQLNLKNDHLRKKFDSIKYDLKKVEEVVYDLTIRGLNKPPGDVKVDSAEAPAETPPVDC